MSETRCFSCGARVPDVDGPVHRYMDSSPGCWALFGQVTAREYSSAAWASRHRLTVDAYAVQHPGTPSPQSIRSVALHLISLHAVLERGLDLKSATWLLQELGERKPAFEWLTPPKDLGEVTVRDVFDATDPGDHVRTVEVWAQSTWQAWKPHHAGIRAWAERDWPSAWGTNAAR